MKNIQSDGSEFNLFLVLCILPIVLKLLGLIKWSWAWVTVPIWVPFGMAFVTVFSIVVFVAICLLVNGMIDFLKGNQA